jgi:hypothetical protein
VLAETLLAYVLLSMTELSMTEATAFMTTLDGVNPQQMTKSSQWTAQELVAHLAAAAAEIARNVEALNEGGPTLSRPLAILKSEKAPIGK